MDPEAERLAEAVEAALPGWVERSVERILTAWQGDVPPDVRARAAAAGRRASADIGPEIRRLLETDVDEQWTGPLDVLRQAVRFPTEVLRDAGVLPVERDEFDERHFPDDLYGLTPMSFADIDPALHETGIRWGAMKAREHLQRRRSGGQR